MTGCRMCHPGVTLASGSAHHRFQYRDRARLGVDFRADPHGHAELVGNVADERALEGRHAERREMLVEHLGDGETRVVRLVTRAARALAEDHAGELAEYAGEAEL